MVEALDADSVTAATRWFLPSGHVYQQSVHSVLQWYVTGCYCAVVGVGIAVVL